MKNTILALFAKLFQNLKSEGEDRISALPDCLIAEILSRLPSTKYAIRTSTLSKRWEHVWTLVPTLIFKYSSAECRQDPNSLSYFVTFVDKTLTQCPQSKLKKFVVELNTNYDSRFESQVNSWIGYAISRGVKELHLRLRAGALLNQSLFIGSCITDLTLGRCNLNPTGAICWKNLRNLCISYVYLDEGLIENILPGSPLLETLELAFCYGYTRLDITSKSVKKLVINGYLCLDNSVVEINAPDIQSLTIRESLSRGKILLLNVSSLIEANLDFSLEKEAQEELLKGLIPNLVHVKELKIGGYCSEAMDHLEAKGFVYPSNLKLSERSS